MTPSCLCDTRVHREINFLFHSFLEMSEDKPVVGPSGRKIIYDKDGKPCRSCNSLLDFKMANFSAKTTSKSSAGAGFGVIAGATTTSLENKIEDPSPYKKDCPPDVEVLGRSTWTFLHSLAATYPEKATLEEQNNMTSFLNIFAKIYPCWFCAKDFEKYITKEETKPKVKTQEEFGKWLCDAHNEVNVKIGKPKFDCNLWKQRWKDGWDDGSCD